MPCGFEFIATDVVVYRFLDSEVELDQAIDALLEIATAPELYGEVRI